MSTLYFVQNAQFHCCIAIIVYSIIRTYQP
nr:MAG TPA: hypothetical protein [Caudoviricetes sp.]